MKRILLIGANGQLGQCLRMLFDRRKDFEYTAADLNSDSSKNIVALDITDGEAVRNMIDRGFNYIVNCAAYTAVDKAEDEPELCRGINTTALQYIGKAAYITDARVIHISTDYVFSGDGHRPYTPEDPANPKSVYGLTKLAGEWELRNALEEEDYVIIRTAWLYSSIGNNFVKTMLRLGKEKDSIRVVSDQIGSPTYAGDLAQAIVRIIDTPEFIPGIFHYTNEGVASWYDLAVAALELAGIRDCKVSPCSSEEYPAKASRPYYSLLSKEKIRATYGIEIPYWRDSLKRCINILTDNGFTE